MTEHSDFDQVSGRTTTGHEWDGIKELNTPLPRWWVITFYLCIVWAVGYWIVYPAWPLVSGYTSGMLHYSSRADVAVELANLEKIRGDKMVALGGQKQNLQAKVFGGACVIEAFQARGDSLGSKNAGLALETLRQEGIPVVADDVGGRRGRKVIFHTDTGVALVRLI